jgi:hypothetical protein
MMQKPEFIIAARLRLGIPLPEALHQERCRKCHAPSDSCGVHLLGCGTGRERTWRHDRLRDALVAVMKTAGVWCAVERPLEASGFQGTAGQRMDITTTDHHIDLTVVNPLQSTSLAQAAVRPGFVVKAAETRKRAKYALAIQQGAHLVPFAGEAYGRFGEPAAEFVRSIGHAAAARVGAADNAKLISRLVSEYWQLLSMALQKGNVQCILAGGAEGARVVGESGEGLEERCMGLVEAPAMRGARAF